MGRNCSILNSIFGKLYLTITVSKFILVDRDNNTFHLLYCAFKSHEEMPEMLQVCTEATPNYHRLTRFAIVGAKM